MSSRSFSKAMDIRCVELYKQFRDMDKPLTKGHEWQVFGYYDSMEVRKLNIPYCSIKNNTRMQFHPLECIYRDSQNQSFNSHRALKKHVIYAIGICSSQKYEDFWGQKNDHPLLLVSLIHFRHPMITDASFALQCIMRKLKKDNNEMDRLISEIKSLFQPNFFENIETKLLEQLKAFINECNLENLEFNQFFLKLENHLINTGLESNKSKQFVAKFETLINKHLEDRTAMAWSIDELNELLISNGMNSIIYMAFDCNDAIVFTLSDSLQGSMKRLSTIVGKHPGIQEIFTIYARKYHIPEEKGTPKEAEILKSLLDKWAERELLLKKVDVFMRNADHSQLIQDTAQFETDYTNEYKKSGGTNTVPVKRFIMPGHEDIHMTLEDVPIHLFNQMFQFSDNPETASLLSGFFVKRFSRTVILTPPCTPIPSPPVDSYEVLSSEVSEVVTPAAVDSSRTTSPKGTDPAASSSTTATPSSQSEKTSSKENTTAVSPETTSVSYPETWKPVANAQSNRAYDLIDKLQKAFEKEKKRPAWLGALMELLVELSNIEVSLTSYDIYIQAIDAQCVMITSLCELLESSKINNTDDAYTKNRKELLQDAIFNSSSELAESIRDYLSGWSQLSFHAMHAEWQLTQSSDINRLYLFPAKLCRLYSLFMEQSSSILNIYGHHDNTVFFLTPNIKNTPFFRSVYRPVGWAYKLILGIIPAENMFSPQVILPILVHEAAHYAGSSFRMRKKRNIAFVKCALAFLLHHLLKEDLLAQSFDLNHEKNFVLNLLVDNLADKQFFEVINKSPTNSIDDRNDYGNQVINNVLNKINELMSLQPSFINALIADVIRILPDQNEESRMNKLLSIAQYYKGPDIKLDMFLFTSHSSIEKFLNDMMDLFRETFSDLCMIKILNLSLEQYLSIVSHGIQIRQIDEENWGLYERFWGILKVAYPDNDLLKVSQENDFWDGTFEKRLEETSSISPEYYGKIEDTTKTLIRLRNDTRKARKSFSVVISRQLHSYLDEVCKALTKALSDENNQFKIQCERLQDVYQVIAVKMREIDGVPFQLEDLSAVIQMMSRESTISEESSLAVDGN